MNFRKKVIIDTDIGDDIDDAFALLTAIYSQKFDILGITTVFRNAVNRAKITGALVESTGANIPVYVGADKPQGGSDVFVFPFEEKDEKGKPQIPHYFPDMQTSLIQNMPAEDFIISMAQKYPGEVTLIAIGPFTNVANAIRKNPQAFSNIKEILFMGGERTGSWAEWNVRCDCESAKIVFDSPVKTTVCGFEITSQSALTLENLQSVRSLKSSPFKLLNKMMEKYIADNKTRIPTMHDPLALCTLLCPENFTFEDRRVVVSLDGETRGKLIYESNAHSKTFVSSANIKQVISYMLNLFSQNDK